jgi:superfamily I DNA/RNA helicase
LVDGSRELGAFQTAKTVISDLVKYKAKANTRMNPKLHREMCALLGIKLDISEHRIKSDNTGGLTVLKTSPEKQAKVLKETLKELLISYGPHEIRILSPFGSNRSLIGGLFLKEVKQNDEVWLRANARHADSNGEIRWRSIPKFKGLESEVVVITDIGLEAAEFFNEKNQSITDWLYVGISRARHRCVVISTEPIEELLVQQTKSTAPIAI